MSDSIAENIITAFCYLRRRRRRKRNNQTLPCCQKRRRGAFLSHRKLSSDAIGM